MLILYIPESTIRESYWSIFCFPGLNKSRGINAVPMTSLIPARMENSVDPYQLVSDEAS